MDENGSELENAQSLRPLAVLLTLFSAACSSTPEVELDIRSNPPGAQVFLSRRGKKAYTGNLGPLKGDVKAEEIEEEFMLLGTTPLVYDSPLHETESDATLLGVGAKVVLKYQEGIVRFEKPGFETVERYVRFKDGEIDVKVKMAESETSATETPTAQ